MKTTLFFKFVWKQNHAVISRSQIVQEYSEGGIKMFDITTHCIVLKVTCFALMQKGGNQDMDLAIFEIMILSLTISFSTEMM